ncbi:MAG: aminotransferase class V-fold PLP-dependent enzyme [Candidatus Acidiferrales bacterium]
MAHRMFLDARNAPVIRDLLDFLGGNLLDYRKEFAEFDDVIYLNAANQGPLPLASAHAAQEAIGWKKQPYQMPDSLYFDLPDRIRACIARLIGADAEDIALTTGASAGMAAVAAGMDWKPGDEVLVGRGEFPAHFAIWLPYQKAGRLSLKVISPRERFFNADDYIQQIGPRTRLVSASLVRFDDGARLDAARVAEACHAAGATLLLDVSQCCGAMPLDVKTLGADFFVCAGYKWLLSPYGTGFFWVKREWSDRLVPGPFYWMALEGARQFHDLPLENLRALPGARRWDSPETSNFINLSAMAESLEFLLRVGVDKVSAHIGRLVVELIERLPLDRCVLASPAAAGQRGPYVCVSARTVETTHALYQKLRQAKIVVSLREGALRIAPHVYNTERDIAQLAAALAV